MSDREGGPEGPRLISVRTMDIVVALMMLGAAAIVISDSLRLGMGWQELVGPQSGYFPFYIGLILAGASAINLLRAVFDTRGAQKTFTTKPAVLQVLAVLIPLVIYVAAVYYIGTYVASAIYMALFMWYFGKYAIWRGALVGLAVSFAFFLMFEIWFLVPLPKGPIDDPLVPIISGFLRSLGLY